MVFKLLCETQKWDENLSKHANINLRVSPNIKKQPKLCFIVSHHTGLPQSLCHVIAWQQGIITPWISGSTLDSEGVMLASMAFTLHFSNTHNIGWNIVLGMHQIQQLVNVLQESLKI